MKGNVIQHLDANGPTPANELPRQPTPEEKDKYGVRKFNVKGGRGSRTSLGKTRPVYYLPKHEPVVVCQTWLDNIGVSPEEHARSIHIRVSTNTNLGDAMKEALDCDLGTGAGPSDGGHEVERECPMCGDTVTGQLPNHLPCEGGA